MATKPPIQPEIGRINFGKILSSLRKQHRDHQLHDWDTKRLGKEAKINGQGELTAQVVANIESGRRAKLDADTLLRLANSLRLSPMERKEFFYAAVGLDAESAAENDPHNNHYFPKDIPSIFESVLQIQTPAYILDQYCDIVAGNSAFMDLFNFTSESIGFFHDQPAGLNLISYIFSEEFIKAIGDNWSKIALNNVLFFRRITMRHRHTSYFEDILNALLGKDKKRGDIVKIDRKAFKTMWFESFDDEILEEIRGNSIYTDNNYSSYAMSGLSFLGVVTSMMTNFGELYPVIYIPQTPGTMEYFTSSILKQEIKILYPIAPWPKKEVYWRS